MPKRVFPFKKDVMPTRQGYEDARRDFSDWVNRLGWEKTFWGRFLLLLEANFRIQRLIYAFLFSIILSFLILFESDLPMDFQVGDVANITVHSPLNFQMVDEVSTELKRIEVLSHVLPVMDLDVELFEKTSVAVMKAFRDQRMEQREHLIEMQKTHSPKWELMKRKFEDDIGISISDGIYNWLVNRKFPVQFEGALLKILQEWYQNKIVSLEHLNKILDSKTVTIRVKRRFGREFIIDKNELVSLGANNENTSLGRDMEHITLEGTEDKDNLLLLAQNLMKPNLSYNEEETEFRRKAARSEVPPVILNVKKNQVIIAEGTIIQPMHLALFHQIEKLKKEGRPSGLFLILGILFTIVILVAHSFFKKYSKDALAIKSKDYVVLASILCGEVIITKIFLYVTETAFLMRFGNIIPSHFFLFLSPLAAGSMLVALLIPLGEVVFIFTLVLSIVVAIMSDLNFSLAFVVWVGGLAAARGVQNCKARNDIYWAGFRSGLVMALTMFCLFVVDHPYSSHFFRESLWMMIAGFASGILSSMWATIFIPLLESVFNYTTDVKLLELSNLNHPLLKEMLLKAPGTYHHSMMVGSMVEAAAEEIGANPLLGKVICYYHDIGKMAHPNYFIENQKAGQNPHDHISPYMSKTLLIAHVKDGVEMGLKHKLGKPIIDGIVQHHGTTVISYFYNRALEQVKDDHQQVLEDEFRYPGPKPQFRETALCMLADSIEAAARTLDEPTPARLQNIVRNVIQKKFLDGQLDECQLTLKDLTKVETAFVHILLGIYHQRIDYPRNFISQNVGPIAKVTKAES